MITRVWNAQRKVGWDMSHVHLALPQAALAGGFRGCSGRLVDFCQRGDFAIGALPEDGGLFTFEGSRALGFGEDGGSFSLAPETSVLAGAAATLAPPDAVEEVVCPAGANQFVTLLSALMPSPNFAYALRVEGHFERVRTTAQFGPEAPACPVRTWENVRGMLLGFYFPSWLESMAWAGCRFHFLSEDRAVGGRLVDCEMARSVVALRHLTECRVGIPGTADFQLANFHGERG